jgi:hypothetical protein
LIQREQEKMHREARSKKDALDYNAKQ